MIPTYDAGSIPFSGDFERFSRASVSEPLLELIYPSDKKYFEGKVIESFIDKIHTGISIPNYPQFRDMNEMFLNCINGLTKTKRGYTVTNRMSVDNRKLKIPEVSAISNHEKYIYERTGRHFNLKICVPGPYTLYSLFENRNSRLLTELGAVISKFIENTVFNGKYGNVSLVAVDEPTFGIIDDPILDHGTAGREELLDSWEKVFQKIRSKTAQSIIHLHKTTNELFWQTKSLNIIESHVDDPLYHSRHTKEYLENFDKSLKASVCITDFDALINKMEKSLGVSEKKLGQRVANVWNDIRGGTINPAIFLEDVNVMSARLIKVVKNCGNRVKYAGPECGLKSFPTYDSAMECLRRVNEATKKVNVDLI
jgi:5-methyltetrahydropteroyltriglutamate--homocysteine methyltransferase